MPINPISNIKRSPLSGKNSKKVKILVCITSKVTKGSELSSKTAIDQKFQQVEKWLVAQSKKTSYPFGSGTKSEAYWESGGWFRDMSEWIKKDNLNNGYWFIAKGWGLEGGRKRIGKTHSVDTDGIVRVFDTMPQGVITWLGRSVQFIEAASKYLGLFDDAQDLNYRLPFIEKLSWLNKPVAKPDTVYYGDDYKTNGRFFEVDVMYQDTTELFKGEDGGWLRKK